MIKIAGLGISGTYLYHRLKNAGFDVSAYDPRKEKYYIPCGYATNEFKISEYMSRINMDFEDYILNRAGDITFTGNNFAGKTLQSSGLCTFDKNSLEADARKNIHTELLRVQNDDIIIDATGISRAYLGHKIGDVQYKTLEYLTERSDYKDFYFYFLPGGRGYFWSFPLGKNFHIGVGTLSEEDFSLVRKYKKIKVTSRNIRMAPMFENVYHGNVIGVGEAIGTVSPITGEGIVPSLQSAEILYECLKINKADDVGIRYQEKIRKKFGYYNKLSSMVSNIQKEDVIKVENILALKSVKRTINDFGIKFDIVPFLRHFI